MGLSCGGTDKRNIIGENKVSLVLKNSLVFIITLYIG